MKRIIKPVIASPKGVAIHNQLPMRRLPRRYAPRNDGWSFFIIFLCCFLQLLTACGSTSTTNLTTTTSITITDFTFVPQTLTASAGDTIFINNFDVVPHRLLSQSDSNQFDDTGDIDSQIILADDAGFLTIPSNAQVGDIFYVYCGFLLDEMATPNITITIE